VAARPEERDARKRSRHSVRDDRWLLVATVFGKSGLPALPGRVQRKETLVWLGSVVRRASLFRTESKRLWTLRAAVATP